MATNVQKIDLKITRQSSPAQTFRKIIEIPMDFTLTIQTEIFSDAWNFLNVKVEYFIM